MNNSKIHLIYDPDGSREYWVDVPLRHKTPWLRIIMTGCAVFLVLWGLCVLFFCMG